MKIEKINKNKLKVILSLEELAQKNISLNDLEKDSTKTRNFFLDLIQEIDLNNSFFKNSPQLFIDATTDSNNYFIITITKLTDSCDISNFDLLNDKIITNSNYKNKNNIFIFNDLNEIINLSKLLNNKYYFGKNSIYSYKNKYYLIFSNYTIKNNNFYKTYNILSEYSLEIKSSDFLLNTLKENGKLILENKAIQKLNKI